MMDEVMDETTTQPVQRQRIEDVDPEAIKVRFAESEEFFALHVDELDYRNYEGYVARANLRWLAGEPIVGVIDDIFLAARCLHKEASLHLARHPNERFLTRRVLPVELGIISGQPLVILEMSMRFGLPLTLLLARSAPDDVFREANLLTRYFMRGSCLSTQDLAGLGALVYAGTIAAIGRGFDDEAVLALNLFAEAREPFQRALKSEPHPTLERYDHLCLVLANVLSGDFEQVGDLLGDLASKYDADLRAKLGEGFKDPKNTQRYFDLSIVAILALCALRQIGVVLPESGAIAEYQDFVTAFTTDAPRPLEEAKLDYKDRMLLKEMGMDPDKVEADLKAQAAEQQQALHEAAQQAARASQTLAERRSTDSVDEGAAQGNEVPDGDGEKA
ncbi:MAG: hypothetical protein CO108_06420 [Deltaproteobacteria bacterium CG_4_9_14_3_um_filter_63_12]|nr:MAG: hypothetical protein CO108_06420 [Deltaproteobacteria bacterium CG_4_9_14_3_um_filter_63_12]